MMNESEAYETLGLDPTASEEEVEKRYRELAKKLHPDNDGDENEFVNVLEAKKVALGEQSVELETVERTIEEYTDLVLYRQEKREESNKTVNRLIRHHTSKYRRKKQMTLIFGAILGVMSIWATFLNLPLISSTNTLPAVVVSIYALAIGMTYWMLHIQAENISTLLTEADEALENTQVLKNILYDIGIHREQGSSFAQEEFVESVEEWIGDTSSNNPFLQVSLVFIPPELDYRKLADEVGPTDFSKLLIRRGLAKELIEEEESFEDGEFSVSYRFKDEHFETGQ